MSDEFHNDEFEQSADSMKVVDGEELSEPEVSARPDDFAPRADAYPQADEYQKYQENYQQDRYQQNGYQQADYGQQNGYRQPNYGQQNGYRQPYYGQAPQQKGDEFGFGLASMILGIVSLLMFCTCVNYILAILAIILGIVQLVRSQRKGMAIAGIVTAGISIIMATFLWIGIVQELGETPFDTYFEQYYDNNGAF